MSKGFYFFFRKQEFEMQNKFYRGIQSAAEIFGIMVFGSHDGIHEIFIFAINKNDNFCYLKFLIKVKLYKNCH